MKYEEITDKQWQLYFQIQNASRMEDIKMELISQGVDIDTNPYIVREDELQDILEEYNDALMDNDTWHFILYDIVRQFIKTRRLL